LGALTTDDIHFVGDGVTTGFFAGWLTPFALVCGLFALALATATIGFPSTMATLSWVEDIFLVVNARDPTGALKARKPVKT
jgi:hypothetical protein